MVHVEGTVGPRTKYLNKESARQRARALAKETRHRVHVLESVLVIEAEIPVVAVTYHESVPEPVRPPLNPDVLIAMEKIAGTHYDPDSYRPL
jgi:hypothetical protein